MALMGQKYTGDINGNLWVNQSPFDACNFKNSYQHILRIIQWQTCGCSVLDDYSTFCDSCYDSYDIHLIDHFFRFGEDRDLTNQKEYIQYEFNINSNFIRDLQDCLNEIVMELPYGLLDLENGYLIYEERNMSELLENDINININNYNVYPSYEKFIDNNGQLFEKMFELTARWVLGKKILKCIEQKGECYFMCEL